MTTTRRPAAGSLDVALAAIAFATVVVGLLLSATSIGGLPWWDHWAALALAWCF